MQTAASYKEEGFFVQTMAEALADPAFVQEVIDCFVATFNAKGDGEWNETWTPEVVRARLFDERLEDAATTILTTWRANGVVAGFSFVGYGPFDATLRHRDLPSNKRTDADLEGVKRQIEWLTGPKPIIADCREIGIRKDARAGLAPVVALLLGPLERVPDDAYICNWTSRKARLMPIILALDVRVVYDFADEEQHVFIGEDARHLRRRLQQPLDVIAKMMKERNGHLFGPHPSP